VSEFARASLVAKTDQSGRTIPMASRQWLPVDFNPDTLKLSITNAMQANTKRRKKEPPQFVTDSTAKLTVELMFDSTTYGNDVREMTSLVAQLMKPKGTLQQQKKKKGIPAIVIFEWGTFVFEGYIENFNETLDFFAAEGVPLRSTVSLSITEQDDPFRAPSGGGVSDVGVLMPGDRTVDDLASQSGDRGAAGRIAAANGIENRRFPAVTELALPEMEARTATGFAGAGIGADPSAGAFAGLNAQASATARPRVELSAEAPGQAFAGVSAGAGVRLGGGGRASASASLSADVGASANARIIFEES
jgi:Contractile injection system tube protein